MTSRHWILALSATLALAAAGAAAETGTRPAKEPLSYGTLRSTTLETARNQSLEWLKASGKANEATLKEFNNLWSDKSDQALLDRVAGTLALGDAEAAKLLTEVRDPSAPAPTTVPDLLKDEKRPAFYRANLALAYAKKLANRRVHEETLDTLRAVKPDQVVDPGSYFFLRAVAEHGMLLKEDAGRSIIGLVEDVSDTPDRYRMLGILMLLDMQNWRESDPLGKLGGIARKMDNIERRLELARGGPKTQKIQKEVVARLDELIKELENQAKGS